MGTPIVAFFREEFGYRRETVAWVVGAVALVFGLMTIIWFQHGVLWDWDFWAGDFGLVVMATIEVILFMWIFKPENAWRSIHLGADIRIPGIYKFI
jgi:SNF family Na+-dependent transporter